MSQLLDDLFVVPYLVRSRATAVVVVLAIVFAVTARVALGRRAGAAPRLPIAYLLLIGSGIGCLAFTSFLFVSFMSEPPGEGRGWSRAFATASLAWALVLLSVACAIVSPSRLRADYSITPRILAGAVAGGILLDLVVVGVVTHATGML